MSEEGPIRLTLEQQDDYAFLIRFDGTTLADLLADEPSPLGHDRGPSPMQLLLASIANCLASSLLFALRKFRNTPGRITARISAEKQRNAEGRWRIPEARVEIELADDSAQYVQLERILAQFEQFCIVTQSVREGIEVVVTVTDGRGKVLLGGATPEVVV